eukprot:764122-Hanusia_phi.AAC.2
MLTDPSCRPHVLDAGQTSSAARAAGARISQLAHVVETLGLGQVGPHRGCSAGDGCGQVTTSCRNVGKLHKEVSAHFEQLVDERVRRGERRFISSRNLRRCLLWADRLPYSVMLGATSSLHLHLWANEEIFA